MKMEWESLFTHLWSAGLREQNRNTRSYNWQRTWMQHVWISADSDARRHFNGRSNLSCVSVWVRLFILIRAEEVRQKKIIESDFNVDLVFFSLEFFICVISWSTGIRIFVLEFIHGISILFFFSGVIYHYVT